jgi:hypothetical protein
MLEAFSFALLPSPLAGEGGLRCKRKTDEGSLRTFKFGVTPHPALRATFSRKGRRVNCSGECHA